MQQGDRDTDRIVVVIRQNAAHITLYEFVVAGTCHEGTMERYVSNTCREIGLVMVTYTCACSGWRNQAR